MRQRERNGFRILAVSILCLGCLFVGRSDGVVIDTGDGSANTTAPPDDPGFANVGRLLGGSATYLGNRWVLTASHVGPGAVSFDNQGFSNIVDESVRLTNPKDVQDELSVNTDLLLIRLKEDPGLPSLRLGCQPVQGGSSVLMIGYGRNRKEEQSFWTVNRKIGDDNDEWTLVSPGADHDESGFETNESRSKRWGWNRVIVDNTDAESGFGDVLSFETVFHPIIDVEDMAQAVRGDSGGAVFQKSHGIWELVGVIHAITLEDNQPGSNRTAIFGNETFSADLFRYADVIRAIADFEPLPGDMDADNQYTAWDIDRMLEAIVDPDNDSCHFDLDHSQTIDNADLDELLTLAGSLVGDANLDGIVDFDDYLLLVGAFGQFDMGWAGGDFDGDGETTFDDFLLLTRSFGNRFVGEMESTPASRRRPNQLGMRQPTASTGQVPEPNAGVLLLMTLPLLPLVGRKRRRCG